MTLELGTVSRLLGKAWGSLSLLLAHCRSQPVLGGDT